MGLLLWNHHPNALAIDTWNTSTIGVDIKTDVTSIGPSTGRTLNISIFGLDRQGNIDVYGESGGSSIIASVTTLLGNSVYGNTSPKQASGNTSTLGTFATTVGYIRLSHGIGLTHITYPNDVSGKDTVKVVLFETRTDESGVNVQTRQIEMKSITIDVAQADPAVSILNIESFTKTSSDTYGQSETYPQNPTNEDGDSGLREGYAKVSVNRAGGLFVVKAYHIKPDRSYQLATTATGLVTMTLTGYSDAYESDGDNVAKESYVYTMTGQMRDGQASLSIPTGITKAGRYRVAATMSTISSINHRLTNNKNNVDYLDVLPDIYSASIKLTCNMSVVSNTPANNQTPDADDDGIVFDPTFTASLLDQYGNYVNKTANMGVDVKISDAQSKIANFTITIPANANTASLLVDSSTFSIGTSLLTATVPLNSRIQPSSELKLKIVSSDNQLAMAYSPLIEGDRDLYPNAVTAGSAFDFAQTFIGVDTNSDGDASDGIENTRLTNTDQLLITNLRKEETISVWVLDGTPDQIRAAFTKVCSKTDLQTYGVLIHHKSESYADCIVYPSTSSNLEITTGSPYKAYIKDYSGNIVTEAIPKVGTTGSFTLILNASRVSFEDAFGNICNTGNIRIATDKGTATDPVAIGSATKYITVTYGGTSVGEDQLNITFTQPGIQSINNGAGLKVKFPKSNNTLATFEVYPKPSTNIIVLPINGTIPITILPKDSAGNNVTLTNGMFIDYDVAGMSLYVLNSTTPIVSGDLIGINMDRLPLKVEAKTTSGTYSIKLRSYDSLKRKTINVKVQPYNVPLQVSSQNVSIVLGDTETISIFGGIPPYSLSIPIESQQFISAILAESTVQIRPFNLSDAPVVLTIMDKNKTQVNVSITISRPPQEYFVGPSLLKLEEGQTGIVNVLYGSPPYTISLEGSDYIRLSTFHLPEDGQITVTGLRTGNGRITVTDQANKESVVDVTVINASVVIQTPTAPVIQMPTTPDQITKLSPLSIGSLITNPAIPGHLKINDTIGLSVKFGKYSEEMKLFICIGFPPDPTSTANILILNSNHEFIPLESTGFIPFATGIGPFVETIFKPAPICTPFGPSIPEGTWLIAWIVIPSTQDIHTVNWAKDALFFGMYSFDVSCTP